MKTGLFSLVSGLCLIALIFVSCQTKVSCELTDEEKKAITQEIETIIRNFMNAETLSFKTHTDLRADKEGYVMGGEGKIKFTSYNDYYQHMKVSFAGIQKFTEFEILSMYTYILAKDAATSTTQLKSKFLTTSGDTIVNNACWTLVFKKFENGWKVIQENGTHTKD